MQTYTTGKRLEVVKLFAYPLKTLCFLVSASQCRRVMLRHAFAAFLIQLKHVKDATLQAICKKELNGFADVGTLREPREQTMAKDHWSSNKYNSAAGFVPQLTSKVVSYLDAQPNDRVLDLGCGDGTLTTQIAQSASSGYVLGLDASQSFISTARDKYSSDNCIFKLADCTKLEQYPEATDGSWDKVFSNAAIHWMLDKPETRVPFFNNVSKALKPGGRFVFEMGGNGNVAEIQAATICALVHAGIPIKQATAACPWFFPSTEWMSKTLSDAGFEVEVCEHEYRSTKLSPSTEDGTGGLEGWVSLMCAKFVEPVDEAERPRILKEIVEAVEPVVTRHEDGSQWLGYCRLRALATKQ